VAVRGDDRRILWRTTSLQGYVRITNADQALELVRLFTNLETCFLFEDFDYVEVRRASGDPGIGELPAADYDRLHISEPSVERHGDWWAITRYVAVERWSDEPEIWWVRELVEVDGAYRLTDRALVTEVADITLPGYW
jgi:hypothetical protein